MLKKTLLSALMLSIAGCQSLPSISRDAQKQPAPKEQKQPIREPSGVVIHPDGRPEIQRQRIVIPEQQEHMQKFEDGRSLPAFKKLMQQAQTAYAKGQLNAAEDAATQAQRIAPQSAETFLYLAMIANRKNQPANAEALAQRGLSYAQSNAMKKQLWQVILKAGQKQNKAASIQKAQQALKGL